MYLDAHFLYQLPDCRLDFYHIVQARVLMSRKVDATMPRKPVGYRKKLARAQSDIFLSADEPSVVSHNAADVSQPQQQIGLFNKDHISARLAGRQRRSDTRPSAARDDDAAFCVI